MNAVPRPVFGAPASRDDVAGNPTAGRAGQVDAEEGPVDRVVFDDAAFDVADANRGAILHVTDAHLLETKPTNGDVVRGNDQDVRSVPTVENCAWLTNDRERPIHDHRRLAIHATADADAITGARHRNRLRQRRCMIRERDDGALRND